MLHGPWRNQDLIIVMTFLVAQRHYYSMVFLYNIFPGGTLPELLTLVDYAWSLDVRYVGFNFIVCIYPWRVEVNFLSLAYWVLCTAI